MSLNLITDRTPSDVSYAKNLQGKLWSKLSTEQKAEYLLGLKGAYSHTDFNRVENAVAYVSELLRAYSYPNVVKVKTDWTAKDIQNVSEIQRYIDNIAELKNKYYSNVEGEMPTVSTWLTIDGANYLEKILVNIEFLVLNMQQHFVYSGVANLGQNSLWQKRFRRPNIWYSLQFALEKYDQSWDTMASQNEEVAQMPIDDKSNISSTFNAWNAKFEEIDNLVGVIE